MASSWQFVPRSVIQQDERQKKAKAWAGAQRGKLAEEWAARKRRELEESQPEQQPGFEPSTPSERPPIQPDASQMQQPDFGPAGPGEAPAQPVDRMAETNDWARQNVPGYAGTGDVLGKAGESFEWLDQKARESALRIGDRVNPLGPRWNDIPGGNFDDNAPSYDRTIEEEAKKGWTPMLPEGPVRGTAGLLGESINKTLTGRGFLEAGEMTKNAATMSPQEFLEWYKQKAAKDREKWQQWETEPTNPVVEMAGATLNPINFVGPGELGMLAKTGGGLLKSAAGEKSMAEALLRGAGKQLPELGQRARQFAMDETGAGRLFPAGDMSIANRTARSAGSVGGKAMVPRYVEQTAKEGEKILDFGSGPKAIHTQALRSKGLDVTAYDFGTNVREGLHDVNALDKQYDTVMASNVLNVQTSPEMLASTLDELMESVAPAGRLVTNLPAEPRKYGITADELEAALKQRFATVRRVGGSKQAPVFEASNVGGTQGGQVGLGTALDLGGGAVGAGAGYDPEASPEENAARMAAGFGAGMAGTRLARKAIPKNARAMGFLADETGAGRLPGGDDIAKGKVSAKTGFTKGDEAKEAGTTMPVLARDDIRAGDFVQSRGDKAIAPIKGKVIKANPKTLVLETSYMGKPMSVTVRRDELRGEVRIKRGDVIHSTEEGVPASAPEVGPTPEPITSEAVEPSDEFIRAATKQETGSATAKSRGYNTIPDREGYEKVYKPYGEEGAGYYYRKLEGAPEPIVPESPAIKPELAAEPTPEPIKAEGDLVKQGAKEPWEMSRKDIYKQGLKDSIVKDKPTGNPKPGTYYHVVPDTYQAGEPIYSGWEIEKRLGRSVPDKWAADFPDYKKSQDFKSVALAETFPEAYVFQRDFLEGQGKILEVQVPAGARLSRNAERIPVSKKAIPPDWIVGEVSHRQLVERSLSEGRSVPQAVLDDYPDLAAKYAKGEQKVGKPVTRKEALSTARETLERAEEERLQAATKEAGQGVQYGDDEAFRAAGLTSREYAVRLKQMIEDQLETAKGTGRQLSQSAIDKLATINELLRGETVSTGMAPKPVFGHPDATNIAGYEHLIPRRADSVDTIDRYIEMTQTKLEALQTKLGQAEAIAKRRVKANPKDVRDAKAYLASAQHDEAEVIRDMLRNETMPELNRLRRVLSETPSATTPPTSARPEPLRTAQSPETPTPPAKAPEMDVQKSTPPTPLTIATGKAKGTKVPARLGAPNLATPAATPPPAQAAPPTPPAAQPPVTPTPPTPPAGPVGSAATPSPDPYNQLVEALTPDKKSIGQRAVERGNAFMRAMYDRNWDLGYLEQQTGVPVHKLAQVVSGSVAAGEDRVRRFVLPVVESVGEDLPYLEQYMVLKRSEDVLRLNSKALLPGNIPQATGVQSAQNTLATKLGPERMTRIENAAKVLWQINDQWILRPLKDAGMLGDEAYQAMRQRHPHYIDFHRADFSVADGLERIIARPEANVSSLNIRRMELEGSSRKLDDPLARTEAQIIRTATLVSRNEAAKAIVQALTKRQRQTGQGLIKVLKAEQGAERSNITDTITFFENGKRVVAQVPPVFATIAKGLEGETANTFVNLLALTSAPLRKGAVTYNPAFLVANPIRDAVSAFFREGLTPLHKEYIQGWVAAFTKNTDFTDAAEAGVLMSGIIDNFRSTDALKRVKGVGQIEVKNWKDALALVPRLIERANLVSEQGTRIATYKMLKNRGLSDLDAAVRARDVTVDFAKSGNVMKMINQLMPFSNAGVQGAANTLRLMKDNPKQALLASSVLAMPTVLTFLYNQRFETSGMIPEYEYANNWVLQVGEGEKRSDPKLPGKKEKFPIYIKIPKGPLGGFVTAPMEMAMRLAFAKDDRSMVDGLLGTLATMGRAISPIEPGLSGITPPVLSTPIGWATNKDIFTGRDIVPEKERNRPPELRYGPETTREAIAIGEQFKVSPRLIDWAVRDYLAGVGQQTSWLADLALGAIGYNPQQPGEGKLQKLTSAEEVARLPVVSRFVGTRNTEQESRGWDRFNRAVEDSQRELASIPEMRRLGLSPGQVSDSITLGQVKLQIEPQERTDLQRETTAILKQNVEKLTAMEKYQGLPDPLKTKVLQQMLDKSREQARLAYLRRFSKEELSRRLRESLPQAAGQ